MKKKKLAAPIIVTTLLCLWMLGWLALIFYQPEIPFWGKLAGAGIPLALVGVALYVLLERIREIRSGDEDDLDNY